LVFLYAFFFNILSILIFVEVLADYKKNRYSLISFLFCNFSTSTNIYILFCFSFISINENGFISIIEKKCKLFI